MKIYSRQGATSLGHGGKVYEADEDGAFDLPEHVAQEAMSFHVGGKPMWENATQRQQRIVAEELERRRDPATLAELVEKLTRRAVEEDERPKRGPAKRAASKSDSEK